MKPWLRVLNVAGSVFVGYIALLLVGAFLPVSLPSVIGTVVSFVVGGVVAGVVYVLVRRL